MKFKNEWFEWLRIYLFNRRGTSRVSAKTDFGNNLFHMSKGKHCYTAGFAGWGKLSWNGGGRRTMKVGGRRIFFESVPSRTEADGGPNSFRPRRTEADAGRGSSSALRTDSDGGPINFCSKRTEADTGRGRSPPRGRLWLKNKFSIFSKYRLISIPGDPVWNVLFIF